MRLKVVWFWQNGSWYHQIKWGGARIPGQWEGRGIKPPVLARPDWFPRTIRFNAMPMCRPNSFHCEVRLLYKCPRPFHRRPKQPAASPVWHHNNVNRGRRPGSGGDNELFDQFYKRRLLSSIGNLSASQLVAVMSALTLTMDFKDNIDNGNRPSLRIFCLHHILLWRLLRGCWQLVLFQAGQSSQCQMMGLGWTGTLLLIR